MQIEIKPPQKQLTDGIHTGTITSITYRTEPYQYTDLHISTAETLLKVGYPTFITTDSKLGQLMIRFGHKLLTGATIAPELLIGKTCAFMTITKQNKNTGKEYATIIPESVKPFTPNQYFGVQKEVKQ